MRALITGDRITTSKYEYNVTEADRDLCLATVKMRGELGSIDTGVTVRLIVSDDKGADALMSSATYFEAFRVEGTLFIAMKYDGASTAHTAMGDGKPVNIHDCDTHYDSNSSSRKVKATGTKDSSFLSRMWRKTWRLWAALGSFTLVPLSMWLIYSIFTDSGHHHVRIGIFIAPFYFVYLGVKYMIGFMTHMTDDEE